MNGAACGKGRRLFLVRIPGQLLRTQPSQKLMLTDLVTNLSCRVRSGETLAEFATFSTHGRERVGAETARAPVWQRLRRTEPPQPVFAEVQWYN